VKTRRRPTRNTVIGASVLVLALVASWATLLPPALVTWRAGSVTSYSTLLRNGVPTTPVPKSASDIDPDDYVAFLSDFAPPTSDPDSDPWLFAALVIGYLRLHNVPLDEVGVAALYSAQTRDWVTTRAGDTWESLAEANAGSVNLWPLLLLLNRQWVAKRGVILEPGRLVAVPLVQRLGLTVQSQRAEESGQ
jgi:hypothetical protein